MSMVVRLGQEGSVRNATNRRSTRILASVPGSHFAERTEALVELCCAHEVTFPFIVAVILGKNVPHSMTV